MVLLRSPSKKLSSKATAWVSRPYILLLQAPFQKSIKEDGSTPPKHRKQFKPRQSLQCCIASPETFGLSESRPSLRQILASHRLSLSPLVYSDFRQGTDGLIAPTQSMHDDGLPGRVVATISTRAYSTKWWIEIFLPRGIDGSGNFWLRDCPTMQCESYLLHCSRSIVVGSARTTSLITAAACR